jgi:hypothetical protein
METGFKDLIAVIKKSPALMIAGIFLIIAVIYIVYKNSQANAGTSTPAATSSTLPTTNAQGSFYQSQEPTIEPIIFQNTPGISATGPAGPTGPAGVAGPQGPTGPAGQTGTIPSNSIDFFIRSAGNTPATSGWDAQHPQGIPIRSSDTGGNTNNIVGYAPFGSQVSANGVGVSGGNNFGGSSQVAGGSDIWYQLSGGPNAGDYISAYDVYNTQSAGTAGTVPSNSLD